MSEQPGKFEVEVELSYPEGTPATPFPYRILLVSDFAGSESAAVAGPLGDGLVEVNAGSFDEVMAAACPSVRLKTTDPLLPGNILIELDLRFDSLRSFDPANVVGQIPATAALAAVREKLVERMRGRITAEQLAEAVARAAAEDAALAWMADALRWMPAKPAADSEVVDSVLDQLDLGEGGDGAAGDLATAGETSAPRTGETPVPHPTGETPVPHRTGEMPVPHPTGETPATHTPRKTPVGALVAAAAGSGSVIPADEASAIRRTLAEIDRRVSAWLTCVLHAPPVQAMESAWRSLAFLVSHIEFRKGILLSVLHARRGELTDRLVSQVIDPVFDAGAEAPSFIAVNVLFGNTAADMETLDELAQHAASLPAVAVAGISAGFFGVKQAWQVPTLPPLIGLLDQYQFAKWRTLRAQPYARALGVVFGRCLLREPHRPEDVPDMAYAYREECLSDSDLVWTSGAVAAAATAARSIADTGWPMAMAGHIHGRLPGFATAQGGKNGEKKFGPSDTLMPQPKIDELAVAGVNAALGQRDHDDVILWNGLTAARLHAADHTALLEVSLPYQLFATRLSAMLLALKPHLPADAASAEKFVTQHVCDWLGLKEPSPDQLIVRVQPIEAPGSPLQLGVKVTPPPNILPGGVPVVLGYRLN